MLNHNPSSIDYEELGARLRAYRIGASLQAENIADQLGVSRAAIYRLEQGKIVKIETLERLAQLLGTSIASLLGVEVEYYASALGFFERLRQVESDAERIVAHFAPISLLLSSDSYLEHLRIMLQEAFPPDTERKDGAPQPEEEISRILSIVSERKSLFMQRRQNIVSLIGLRELERFLQTGMIGRLELDDKVRQKRIQAARNEVQHIAELMEQEPMHIKIALVEDAMPATAFQLLYRANRTMLTVSPFRLGEMPTIRNGVATVTAAHEPVRLYENMIDQLWKAALKGKTGAAQLRKLLKRAS